MTTTPVAPATDKTAYCPTETPHHPKIGQQEVVVALVGQPNTGKSSIFNRLTGMRQHVGNWPGKTVDQKTGHVNSADRTYTLVDLPGCYGLSANSPEELIARDYVISDEPDIVVAVVNAAALERTLYLVAELSVLDVPVVIALNMLDVAEQEGVGVDARHLADATGMPVVPMVASRNKGMGELLDTLNTLAPKAAPRQPGPQRSGPRTPPMAEGLRNLLRDIPEVDATTYPLSDWMVAKIIEGDTVVVETLQQQLGDEHWQKVENHLKQSPDAFRDLMNSRRDWIDTVCAQVVTNRKERRKSPTDLWDKAFLHPFWGPALSLLIIPIALVTALATGLFPAFKLYGLYFFVRTMVMEALSGALGSLLSNGIMLPVTWIASLSLILFILFAVLAFFEDIGFMARTAFLADTTMRKVGLDGKSIIPLFFSFICNACAVLGARVIGNRNRRLRTIVMTPLIPCSAQIMVASMMIMLFFPFGTALTIILLLTAFNVFCAGLVGKWMHHRLPDEEIDGLMMELPLFHRPNLRTIFISAWTRVSSFITRGATLMLPVMILFWAVSYFPDGNIETSYIARAGRFAEPLTGLMGLDWRFTGALLFSFIARENTLTALSIFLLTGTQNQMYFTVHGPEKDVVLEMVRQSIAPAGALAFIVASNFFIPCAGTIGVLNSETKSLKWTAIIVVALLGAAFILAVLTYQAARLIF